MRNDNIIMAFAINNAIVDKLTKKGYEINITRGQSGEYILKASLGGSFIKAEGETLHKAFVRLNGAYEDE